MANIQGISPPQFNNSVRIADDVMSRKVVVNAWNKNAAHGKDHGYHRVTSPFPAIYGLTDFLGRQNYTCDIPNPIQKNRFMTNPRLGFVQNCDSTGVKGSGSNPKFVPDSSDYTQFKKLLAMNKSYNDPSFGGNVSNANYPVIMAIHRF